MKHYVSKSIKRKAITLTQKVEIIRKLQNNVANAQICRDYGLQKSTVSTIWANREKYLSKQHITSGDTKKLRSSSNPVLDESLLKWFSLKRSQNVPISAPVLQAKATEFGNLMKQPLENENAADHRFACSKSWIDRFKRRHDIKSGKIHGESAAVSQELVNQWLTSVWPSLKQKYRE